MDDSSYRLYYTAGQRYAGPESHIGMATSKDGIHWMKYAAKPAYRIKDNPLAVTLPYCRP